MAETIDIFSLKIDLDAAIASTADLADETARLKMVMDATNKSTDATTAEQVQAKAAYDATNSELKEQQRELSKMLKLKDKEIKTVQQGRNALAVMNKEWAKQASLYGANSKEANKLADKTLQLRTRLKDLEKGVGDTSRNVGNYSDGITEALGKNNLFAKATQNMNQAMGVAKPLISALKTEASAAALSFKSAAAGTAGMSKAQKAAAITSNILSGALKILKVALIATGIGAIVVALGSLIAYFSNTQRGADEVSKAMAGLGAAFDVVIDRLSQFGGALVKFFSGDFAGAAEDMEGAFAGIGDEIAREVGLALELEKATQKLADSEIKLIGVQAERKNKIEELRFLAKDEQTSLVKRAELLQQAGDLEKAIAEDNVSIAKERARISQAQLDLGESTREQIKENAALQAEVVQKETESLKLQRSIEAEKQGLQKRARAEQATAQKAELAAAKKITDQALKDNKTRLALFVEQSKGKTDVLETGLVFYADVMAKELELEAARYESGKTNAIEYELAQLEIKNKSLAAQAALTKEFADAQIETDKAAAKLKKEEDKTAAELEKEKQLIEFEAKQETRIAEGEWYFDILRTDLEAQKKAEIANAERVGADTTLIKDKYSALFKKIKRDETNYKLNLTSDAFGQVAEMLGKETAAGKAAAIAQTTIQTYLGAQQAFTSLSIIPVIGTVLGGIAAAAAVVAGLANVRKIASTPAPTIPKAESGALFSIGGQRHSEGGTKFTGEDGTQFEAERGELIGVMNRRASAHFMQYNNTHGAKGTRGNYFADGGIVTRGLTGASQAAKDAAIDYDLLAAKMADANASLPAPVVIVEDINTGQENLAEVEQGANV